MSDSLRQSFERMMESMFLNPDWKNVVPIRQQLEFEDVFMGAAQTVFLEIVKSNGQCVPDLDNQLREFGQRIVTRYEEAGIDLTDANKAAEEFAAKKAAEAAKGA